MAFWTYNGLKFGIKSVKFPREKDFYDGFISSIKVDIKKCLNFRKTRNKSEQGCKECELICPTESISIAKLLNQAELADKEGLKAIDAERCIFCGFCIDACINVNISTGGGAITYADEFEFNICKQSYAAEKIFKKSLFVKHIDTGSCGACESEINALNNPYYNMHRLGIFITPSPRFADVLLATGVFTEKMTEVFFNVLDNIPKPRFIILAGSCAITRGIYENKETTSLSENQLKLLEAENIIALPHCPPNPFEILNVLLLIKNGELK
jgi:Ni,Fe-hydrogenase III small subunit/NAD-dependent dihydropyrimidine dehydrogenase PreA subunit